MFYFLSFQAYYREGVALQGMGKDAESLAAFAAGLAQDPKSNQLLSGMVETALKSPLKGNLILNACETCFHVDDED